MIKLTVRHDFRCFKKDSVYELDLRPGEITFMVGDNGCGKSSIMLALRSKLDSLAESDNKNSDGMKKMTLLMHYLDVKTGFEIEGFEFDKAFFRDTVVDNPTSFINSATAYGLVMGGGLSAQHRSAGQVNIDQIIRFISDIVKTIGEHSDERILIGIDELDDSLCVRSQLHQVHIMSEMLLKRYPNASILYISHSIVSALGIVAHPEIPCRCYDIPNNRYCDPTEYFKQETGFDIKLYKQDNDEHQEENR